MEGKNKGRLPSGRALLFFGVLRICSPKNVVADFGEISEDNHNIITMKWVVEGVALILKNKNAGIYICRRFSYTTNMSILSLL